MESLGQFEQIVLTAILALDDNAYGVTIHAKVEELSHPKKIARGAYFDASYRERERSIACRFRLCREIVLWPFDVTGAEYFSTAGALQALGVPVAGEASSVPRSMAGSLARRPDATGCSVRSSWGASSAPTSSPSPPPTASRPSWPGSSSPR